MEHIKIPINVITGFLGSGKTTLLSNILKNKKFKNTAVIINEFGEVGLDHNLIKHSDEKIIELQDGCICCSIQGDLKYTLLNLYKKKHEEKKYNFNRIIIETTGLADPLPISDTLINSLELQKIYKFENLIAVVDAINCKNTLRFQKESVRQVYLSNIVIISKTDLVNANEIKSITRVLNEIKPNIKPIRAVLGVIPINTIFPSLAIDKKKTSWKINQILNEENIEISKIQKIHKHNNSRHEENIHSFAMKRDIPINKKIFDFFIETLEKEMGPYLLRVKGILNIQGDNKPTIIQGAQNFLHPVERLDEWPDEDKSTRIVFITNEIKKETFKGFCTSILGLEEY
tara:strand:- start:401 stop:1432 length:1032 start_codon:yes stop_codon:yes gene_type:complete